MNQVMIIGAGILGTSTAYHLAKSGADVTVFDDDISGRATDAAAGIICPWISQRRNKAWYTLAKNGAAYYSTLIRQLSEEGEQNTGYQKVGAISLHTDDEKLIKMAERAIKRREDAPEIGEVKLLTEEETKALFPPLATDFKAVYVEGAARVNGRLLRESLKKAAEKYGAKFVKGNAEILLKDGKLAGIKTGEVNVASNTIIVTAGAWAEQLLKPLQINFKVSSQKGQIVHLQIKDQDFHTDQWPVVMPPNDQYILAFENGQIVIGATHENEVGFDTRVTAGGIHEVFEKALSVAPGLIDATFKEVRVGFRPFTANFLPVIGEIDSYKGLFVANGLGASGLTVGPYLGNQLAKLVLNQPLDIDLSLYDVRQAME